MSLEDLGAQVVVGDRGEAKRTVSIDSAYRPPIRSSMSRTTIGSQTSRNPRTSRHSGRAVVPSLSNRSSSSLSASGGISRLDHSSDLDE